MMIFDSKQKFVELHEKSSYIRVSDSHPLDIYLGIDLSGNKVLRLNELFKAQIVKSSVQIKVSQYQFDDYNSILFANMGDDEIFYYFCNDLVTSSLMCNPQNGYKFLIKRYLKWMKMFASSQELLSEAEIMGLIGELLFLKEYSLPKYGVEKAILGWSGTEPTLKDFSYDDEWFEIKSISCNRNTVNISSIEQLDSNFPGKLIVHRMEKMSPLHNGVSLNKLVTHIKAMISEEEVLDSFENKLIKAKYVPSLTYDDIVFSLVCRDAYAIAESFPRFKKESVPREVVNVKYELLLNMIEDYKVVLP